MSLDNLNIVDAIGTDKKSGAVTLTVLDSWDWVDEQAHLAALADKINTYLAFVESGEIYDAYPSAAGKPIEICVIGRFQPSFACGALIEQASSVAGTYNVKLFFQHRPEGKAVHRLPQSG